MSIMELLDTGMLICSFCLAILTLVVIVLYRRLDLRQTRYLLFMAIVNIWQTVTYLAEYMLRYYSGHLAGILIRIIYLFEFVVAYIPAFILLYYLADQIRLKGKVIRWIRFLPVLMGVYLLPYLINLYYPLIYTFDAANRYRDARFYIISELSSLFLAVLTIIMIRVYRNYLSKSIRVATSLFLICPVISVIIMSFFSHLDIMDLAMSLSVFLMSIYLEVNETVVFYQREKEMEEMKSRLLIMQLRPHFMYNAMSSISQLCKEDPQGAAEMTDRFSEFLAKNMLDVQRSEAVPFAKELEYIQNYMAIEQMRFGEDLVVEYVIDHTDFYVPPMVLQPLLENSIKHGIGGREDGGMIMIAAEKTGKGSLITIMDDGVGFDPAEQKADGRVHLGLQSVRARIEAIPGARIKIRSVIGEGSTIRILIPHSYPA